MVCSFSRSPTTSMYARLLVQVWHGQAYISSLYSQTPQCLTFASRSTVVLNRFENLTRSLMSTMISLDLGSSSIPATSGAGNASIAMPEEPALSGKEPASSKKKTSKKKRK